MKNKAIIGISGNFAVDYNHKMVPGVEKAYVFNYYVEAIALAGGVPVILPIVSDPKAIKKQVESVDGLLLSGGHDITPFAYDQEPHPLLQDVLPRRDDFDFKLIECALEAKKPILGICRGMQALNVMFGGDLYQDVSLAKEYTLKHVQGNPLKDPTHTIDLVEGTRLQNIFKTKSIRINTYHHQAIHQIADGFYPSAFAKDGMIEAIEKDGDSFVMGVQWHPEMMAAEHPTMLKLFKFFVKESISET